MGSRDFDGAVAQRSRLEDLNEHGMDDLFLRFGIEETGLPDTEDNTVVLTGGFVGGSDVFKSYDTISNDNTPLDQCYTVAGANATGIRCEIAESLVPLDLASLVADINAIVDDDFVTRLHNTGLYSTYRDSSDTLDGINILYRPSKREVGWFLW